MEKEQYELMRRLEDSLWWYEGMRRIVLSLLAGFCQEGKRWRMLDAGCGTGATLQLLAPRGDTYGIDIAEEALAHCRRRGQRHLSYGSIEHLPFPSNCFDLVTSFDVIYHQAVTDDTAALREFHRVLRPGGVVVLRVPAYDWLRGAHDRAVHTRHRYTRGELSAMLTAAGFRVRRATYANCLLLPMAIAKRLLEGRGAKLEADLRMPGPLANRMLTAVLELEARLVRRISFPCGLSVIAVATKEPAA